MTFPALNDGRPLFSATQFLPRMAELLLFSYPTPYVVEISYAGRAEGRRFSSIFEGSSLFKASFLFLSFLKNRRPEALLGPLI